MEYQAFFFEESADPEKWSFEWMSEQRICNTPTWRWLSALLKKYSKNFIKIANSIIRIDLLGIWRAHPKRT